MSISESREIDFPSITLLPLARDVRCDEISLQVQLVDGRTICAPLAWFPRLFHATPERRSFWMLIGLGEGIHWPDLDEDISVASLLGLPVD